MQGDNCLQLKNALAEIRELCKIQKLVSRNFELVMLQLKLSTKQSLGVIVG